MKNLAIIIIFFLHLNIFSQNISLNKLSEELAIKNAKENLIITIENLEISDAIKVKDFIEENEKRKYMLVKFLDYAVEKIGKTEYKEDKCVVKVAITTQQLIKILENIWKKYPAYYITPDKFYNIKEKFILYSIGYSKLNNFKNKKKDFWTKVEDKGKMIALRHAKVDAYTNLGEIIKSMKLSSDKFIRDFILENEKIRYSFNNFIRNIETFKVNYKEDGVVEVILEIKTQEIILTLMNICQNDYKGYNWIPYGFYNIRKYNNSEFVRAAGYGVPPVKYIEQDYKSFNLSKYNYSNPSWINNIITAEGIGYAKNIKNSIAANLLAKRAAKLDAYRQMAEKIMGLEIKSNTKVKDFLIKHDKINAKIDAIIKGAKIISEIKMPDGSFKVILELNLNNIWEEIKK